MLRSMIILSASLVAGFAASAVPVENKKDSVPGFLPSSYSASLSHYLGARDDSDPLTSIVFSAGWKSGDWSGSITQPFSKYYVVNSGEDEVRPSDSILGVSRKLDLLPFAPEWSSKGRFSLTLPVSEFSRMQGVVSKPKVSLSLGRSFFNEALNYSLAPSVQYFFNRYKTTKSSVGDGGGTPLRQYMFKLSQSLTYSPIDDVSLSGSISYVQTNYEDLGFENRTSTTQDRALSQENYELDFSASYSLTEKLSLALGYGQSDKFERTYGSQEFYLFDEFTTQFYVSAASTF